MIWRLGKIAICVLASVATGVFAYAAVVVARSPQLWTHPNSLWDLALIGALFYVAIPVVILALISVIRPIPSTALAVFVAITWLTVMFGHFAYTQWAQYGEFPWWGFRRYYLAVLPVPFSFGLVFALCARSLLGSNNRLERP